MNYLYFQMSNMKLLIFCIAHKVTETCVAGYPMHIDFIQILHTGVAFCFIIPRISLCEQYLIILKSTEFRCNNR